MKVSIIFTHFLLLLLPLASSLSSPFSDGFLHLRSFSPPRDNSLPPQQQLQVTQPLPSDLLTPACYVSLLSHSFGQTIGEPPVDVEYSSPETCPSPSSWSNIVLEMNATCIGEQYDRIAGVWLDGVEILRTSTPEPTPDGIFWSVRKDVTRYSSLFARSNISISVMLENVFNDVYTGVFHVNLTLLVYTESAVKSPSIGDWFKKLGFGSGVSDGSDGNWLAWDQKPADLIVPVSDNGDLGFWFRIGNESVVGSRSVEIPKNARKIVLELYVSAHGDDEFWYSNPPDFYILTNNLTTKRGNGAFREVFVRIDGNLVASEIPFPVIFTGGINPLFWEPVVAIGAFDLPSYDFDLTPFLGLLLDGKNHSFQLGVGRAIDFWLVDANLHVWLDKGSEVVEAGAALHHPPRFGESWEWKLDGLDGEFEVEAERSSHSSGWVACSCGNVTTRVVRKIKFKNKIKFKGNGTYKSVKQHVKLKTEVTLKSSSSSDADDNDGVISKRTLKRKYPLTVIIDTQPGAAADTYLMRTNVSHALNEKSSFGRLSWTSYNRQRSGGWMAVKDHSVLSGAAHTHQSFSSRNQSTCYTRQVEAADAELLTDVSTSVCPSILHELLDKYLFLGW
uniref:Peptide-N4-(N-acetyl-beta-glucosaminyl)asparagine amidase A n=1 Tax=Fagopyrum tataricum TaxID=62330 RepID=A0A2H4P6A1_FAGTA|nr:peptide-N4-(N-acetyl-beta-glucosaminyl)asparagine amidase A [Fagopyrum tataricum]